MRAEAQPVRPVFLAPWWWFVWAGGKRFSLRRGVSIALVASVIAELVAAAAGYAFRGKLPTVESGLMVARLAAYAVTVFVLLEPLLLVAADSMRARRYSPGRLREVSYGLQAAYAAALAYGAYLAAPHVPALGHLLGGARRANGWWGGTARFLLGGTLLWLPVVVVTRFLAMRTPRAPVAVPAPPPHVIRRADQGSIPFAGYDELAPGLSQREPATHVPIAPARIVGVDVRPRDP